MIDRVALVGVIVAAAAWAGPARSIDEAPFAAEDDLEYARRADGPLKLDLARPVGREGPFPAVVVFYGGAWRSGDKASNRPILAEFARRGFVAISPQYRHCPEHRFPAQVHDAKAAVRWLRAHAAEYRVDPDRLGAMGFSAGAHLALMLGATGPDDGLEGDAPAGSPSSRVRAVVNYFGPVELDADDIPVSSRGLLRDFLGGTSAEVPEAYKKASPLTYLTADDAAILTFHGTKDAIVPATQATRLAAAMTRAGLDGRAELIIGAGHGWPAAERARTMDETYRFFEARLRPARP